MSQPQKSAASQRMPRWVFLPLGLFLGMVVFLAVGLNRNPQEIPSPLIGRPAPLVQLPSLGGPQNVSAAQFKGQLTLVNFWATWCAGCKEEHPILMALARQPGLQMLGINYKELQASELSGQAPQSPESLQKATAAQPSLVAKKWPSLWPEPDGHGGQGGHGFWPLRLA